MGLGPRRSPTLFGRLLTGGVQALAIPLAWFIGLLLAFVLIVALLRPVLLVTLVPLLNLGPTFGDLLGWGEPLGTMTPLGFALGLGLTVAFVRWIDSDHYRRATAAATAPFRRHKRMAGFGKGGSARFAGMIEEWESPYEDGAILLGRSLYDDRVVGTKDDRGLLTIASNRSGKGRCAIIPNLLLWPGSAVVIDPKGTNAAVTAARRGHGDATRGGRVTQGLGQAVHVLDPFGIVPGVTPARFNPMDGIDLTALTAKEDVGLLADALIVPSGAQDTHWDESARLIVAGVIAHLLSRNPGATLLDVRDALTVGLEEREAMFDAMLGNSAAGGLPKAAAALVDQAGDREAGAMMTTVMRNTAWLDSLAMRQALARSDFSIGDIKRAPTTIYVVLPPDKLEEHARFMRLFVNLTVRAAAQGGKSRVPILLLMDEFFALGPLESLMKASGALAGYGLKLWPILQNLSQLRQLYPNNWQTFLANAGAVQIFGVNDRETAGEIVAQLGQTAWLERIEKQSFRVVSNLLESVELQELTARDSGLQLVLRSGASPLLLKKMPYDQDEAFDRSEYNPDPDHPGS